MNMSIKFEYKNLVVAKNRVSSFSFNVDENSRKDSQKRRNDIFIEFWLLESQPTYVHQILVSSMSSFFAVWH